MQQIKRFVQLQKYKKSTINQEKNINLTNS